MKVYKVYIGVGHGGSDPGAVFGKHRESVYALDISTACTTELRRNGVEVMQSRTTDTTESASSKIRECNTYAPDVALDIHLNSGGGDGFEVFRSIAGGEGEKLAASIEKAVIGIGQNSRGIKTRKNSQGRDYFGFIRQTDCPAVLVECAFLDTSDVHFVDTLPERQKFGKAIAHGILDYFGIVPKQTSPANSTLNEPIFREEGVVLLPVLDRRLENAPYQVERVQLCLNQMGWTGADDKPLAVDGDFGTNTEAAIKKLQKAHNIEQDGRMTAKTWRALLVFKK